MSTDDPNFNKFSWIIIGLLATVSISGIGTVVVMYANQAATGVRLSNIEASLMDLKASVADGTRNRYTGDQAAIDRAAVQGQIDSMRAAWATSFAEIVRTNTQQDSRIALLEITNARMLERLGPSKGPLQ